MEIILVVWGILSIFSAISLWNELFDGAEVPGSDGENPIMAIVALIIVIVFLLLGAIWVPIYPFHKLYTWYQDQQHDAQIKERRRQEAEAARRKGEKARQEEEERKNLVHQARAKAERLMQEGRAQGYIFLALYPRSHENYLTQYQYRIMKQVGWNVLDFDLDLHFGGYPHFHYGDLTIPEGDIPNTSTIWISMRAVACSGSLYTFKPVLAEDWQINVYGDDEEIQLYLENGNLKLKQKLQLEYKLTNRDRESLVGDEVFATFTIFPKVSTVLNGWTEVDNAWRADFYLLFKAKLVTE
jgi:hypothetical protein